MTAFKRGAARIGAALAITALTLAGITGTHLTATAAEVTTEPPQWLADEVFRTGTTLDPSEWASSTLQNSPSGTGLCLDPTAPSIGSTAHPYSTIIFQTMFPSIEGYDAANGVFTYDLNALACAEQWDLTGRWAMKQVESDPVSESLWTQFRSGDDGVIETPPTWNQSLRDTCADALANGTAAGCGSVGTASILLERSDGTVLRASFRTGFIGITAPPVDPDPVDPVLTAELFVTEAEQYETVTVTPEDLFTGCALDGVVEDCAADRAYFVSVPSGATTTTRGDGSEVMDYIGFEAGDYSFQFVIWDSVLGVYSAPQQGIIRISAMPGFLGVAEAPSKSFSIVAGETITITHDMLGDVYATAFEGDEPVFIDPWLELSDGSRVPHWTVVYLDAPEGGELVQLPVPDGMSGEAVTELVFTSNTPGVYYFTYRIEIDDKGFGFVTPPITSTITVTAEVPELPKVTG